MHITALRIAACVALRNHGRLALAADLKGRLKAC